MQTRLMTCFLSLVPSVIGLTTVNAQNLFQGRIDTWVSQDSLNPPPDNAIVFIGDSHVRTWESLTRDFSNYDVIQRGFGGARLSDLNLFVSDIVLPYDPAGIVVVGGTNDRAGGKTAEQIFDDYVEFINLVHTGQDPTRPPIPVLSIGIPPSPGLWSTWKTASAANSLIDTLTQTDDNLYYIDTTASFLATSPMPGQPPSASLFVADGVHLSAQGYTIWSDAVAAALDAASLHPKSAAVNPLHPQPGSRILVDFGPSSQPDGQHTTSPDGNGNYWNNWHPVVASPVPDSSTILPGESIGNLITTEGEATGIDLIVTGEFGTVGRRHGGLLDPDATLLGDFAVATATEDYFWAGGSETFNGTQTGGFMLAGLEPSLTYDLRFFGTRTSRGTQSTDYHVLGGGEPVTVSLQTSGGGIGSDGLYDGNDSTIATAEGVRTDEFGQIFIDLNAAGRDRTYLGIMEISVGPAELSGDFNGNGVLDVTDVNQLAREIAAETHDVRFDLTDDNTVSQVDLTTWVKDLKHTWFGDANFDGQFDNADIIAVLQGGKYSVDSDAGWNEGDWTGDLRFDSADLIAALQDGGFAHSPTSALNAVPEPTSLVMLIAGTLGIAVLTRRQHRQATAVRGLRRGTR